jgi:hypothetical protein
LSRAFVLMEYFENLRRDPSPGQAQTLTATPSFANSIPGVSAVTQQLLRGSSLPHKQIYSKCGILLDPASSN